MRKLTVLILSWSFLSYDLSAQTARVAVETVPDTKDTLKPPPPKPPPLQVAPPGKTTIKGKIADTTENKLLYNSAVLLLRKSDSIIVSHTRTDKAGNFTLKKIPPGKYLILATFPFYADYVDELEIKDSGTITLPPIGLLTKSKLLEQVVVNGSKGAIHIKGDTVEFRADSFRTEAGANVEALLKKLPGIQVDKNGKITAQGETVQKVLVDGEEFFGDDPTLVTQNLRADMVDKVQLYDKKSDQANFTGIDDGEKTKTINIKLKDNKKNGYFGRVSGAKGTDGYYDAQAMLNAFRKKQKLAAYGIVSNTGKIGLDWNERDNYGQSIAGMADFDEASGSYSISFGSNDLDSWDGKYSGQGLPSVKTGGLHFNNKWDDDRQSFNGNYKYMHLNVRDSSDNDNQNVLPDSLYTKNQPYINTQQQQTRRTIIRHSADINYEIKYDSTSSLKIMADGGTDHKITNTAFTSGSLARDSSLITQNQRTVSTEGDNNTLNSNILWRKKLAKKGRTLSINFRENYNNNTSSGFLNSKTDFYDQGVFSRDSVIDQFKSYKSTKTLLDGKITYTEPLSATSFLIGNYGASIHKDHSNRNSFNNSGNGKYSLLDSLYSNDYQFDVFTQSGGLVYSMVKKKFRFNFGSNLGSTHFDQKDLHADTSVKRNFINWYPQAMFSYNFGPQRRLSLNYHGSTSQPSISQIQPTRTNENPLYIYIGNPNLKQQFSHNIYLNFSDYKVLTDRSIWANMSYNFTENAISNRSDVDTTGKTTSQSVNLNGNHSFNSYLSYNFKWKAPDIRFGLSANTNVNSNVGIVNGLLNSTTSANYELGASMWHRKEKIYDANLRVSAKYSTNASSINRGLSPDYWTYTISPGIDLYLPFKINFHTDCDITLRQKTAIFQKNNNISLLNASLVRKFLKNDALQVQLSGNDLLNQNIGFNRYVSSNFISQSTYLTIKRYFMFSVSWNFNKLGAAPPRQ